MTTWDIILSMLIGLVIAAFLLLIPAMGEVLR